MRFLKYLDKEAILNASRNKGEVLHKIAVLSRLVMEVLRKRRELTIEKNKFADLGIFRGFAYLVKLRTLHKGRISVRHAASATEFLEKEFKDSSGIPPV